MKKRVYKTVMPIAILMAVGILYIIFIKITGLSLFCPINKFLGIYCPGCGLSRMILNILHLDFARAFSSNCLAFVMIPVFLFLYLHHCYRYIRYNDSSTKKWEEITYYVLIGLFLAFAVVRNLYPIDILVP